MYVALLGIESGISALESDALPIELRGSGGIMCRLTPRPTKHLKDQKYLVCKWIVLSK